MSDPLDLVRDLAPMVEHRPELVERVRNDLMATIDQATPHHASTPVGPPDRRRVHRRWASLAAAAVVSTTAAAGWALTRTDADSTAVQCPGNTIIDAVTGDPVIDCSNEWRRSNGTEPPAMVAYDNGNGGVTVLAASDTVPDRFTELEPGSVQTTDLIQLSAALGDVGNGLTSGCYDEGAARGIVRSVLDQVGLASWTVLIDDTRPPDGDARCADFVVDAANDQVRLIGIERAMTAAHPYRSYATALAERLAAVCTSLEDAAALTRSLAAQTTVIVDGARIDVTEGSGGPRRQRGRGPHRRLHPLGRQRRRTRRGHAPRTDRLSGAPLPDRAAGSGRQPAGRGSEPIAESAPTVRAVRLAEPRRWLRIGRPRRAWGGWPWCALASC